MKLLIIAPRFPYPLDKGDRLTVYNLARYFSGRHEVILLAFMGPQQRREYIEELTPFCHRIEVVPLRHWRAYSNCALGFFSGKPLQVLYYSSPEMTRKVDMVFEQERPDLIYAHTIRMAEYVRHLDGHPKVLAMQVSMSLNYRRLAEFSSNSLSRLVYSSEHYRLKRYERQVAQNFDRCLVVSWRDREELERAGCIGNIDVIPHGVDFRYFGADPNLAKEPNSIIFTGNLSYAPNVDAVLYFYKAILPLIREQIPGVRFYVVGTSPKAPIRSLNRDPRIVVTGFVNDIRPYLSKSQVAIDPLRIGAGLQNKVLEAMSMGLPVVATPVANEGIGASHGDNILIADEPRAFARTVVRLLKDPGLRRRIGSSARAFVEGNWSWETHFATLEELFLQLASGCNQ